MNDHQLLCFLTVTRTLNFTAAAKELYCTQPALSYQIRSLEKELGLDLFTRSTTQVALTDAGRALRPHAEQIYRQMLETRRVLKAFEPNPTLRLRLPPVLLQRDPIYPVLMARLRTALPGCEIKVDTQPIFSNLHRMLCTEVDAALYPPFRPMQDEVVYTPILHNHCYLVAGLEHPLHGRAALHLADLTRQRIFYEPVYGEIVQFLRTQPGMPFHAPDWLQADSYEACYSDLLAGQCLFFSSILYPAFPKDWYLPLELPIPIPDTCLLTLREDPRPEIQTLRETFVAVYQSYGMI